MRQVRTVFGGSLTDGRPVATMTLIGLCVAVYVLQWVVPGLTERVWFVPALGEEQPWRFVTSAFAHSPSSLLHIGFNMYALWFMGTYLEPLLGRARFVAVYLLSALGGSVMHLLLAPPRTVAEYVAGQGGLWWTPAVGASGAVFGLFGAFLVLQRRLGRSAAGMYVIIAINAVIGFVVPNIAWQAHLGGLVTGAAAAAVIAYTGRSRGPTEPANRQIHWLGLGALLGVLVALALLKYAVAG
jgi:membrane associated rhomboid family serine protease